MVLDGLCAWIDKALVASSESKVLIHCVQGISRSGAIIIAYSMRKGSLDYDAALAIARKLRAMIAPNSGFADQLRLWTEWNWSCVEKNQAGDWMFTTAYDEWRENRGILLSYQQAAKQDDLKNSMLELLSSLNR
jgi:hypothetical protein